MPYKQKNKQKELSKHQISRALQKRIAPYQLRYYDRLTSGKDHWDWFATYESDRIEFIVRQVQKRPPSGQIMSRITSNKVKGDEVRAFILDGRWIARCDVCGGQEVVDPEDPVFVCLNPACFNIANSHYPRPVKFPRERRMKAIAKRLLARPNPINRNWLLHELSSDLEQENVIHGVERQVDVEKIDRRKGRDEQ